ncbi:MAG: phospholipid carrier-dependent glycosyltransferase [Candidatus Pacebacteria bacterium]|nr:phospholipid carrier-dependent glycosyltransferase [Candidatus Paceibacterota bacterium]NUQ57463.1 phospholipid carrier-dependent glycosyltransferase [Candidatus Paceibacter sp.]
MIQFLKKFFSKKRNLVVFYAVAVLIASYFTYFKNYDYPPAVFWDENYHIASAQKYLEGVIFMEPHPPLGKMFIALGEYMMKPNRFINQDELHKFTQTDYIKDFPAGYSFAGVRLFSTLFAWFSAVLFFLIFYLVSKNAHLSALFSSLYVFDNALIIHSRAAMLEGSHLFFILLAALYFVYLLGRKTPLKLSNYFLFGFLVGIPIMIKATGGILLLLLPFLLACENWEKIRASRHQGPTLMRASRSVLDGLKITLLKSVVFVFGAVIVFFAVWQIHFSLGKKIEGDKSYRASEEYKAIIAEGKTTEFKNFPAMVKDNLAYMANYNKGVPVLDVCKPDENGSHPMTWPLGDKSINYRWERSGDGVRYMYLQSNPATWLLGLSGIVISLVLIVAVFLFRLPIKDKKLFYLISAFAAMYVSYMAVMLRIERVMYLYHYFIPLVFSFILAFLVFNYIFAEKLAAKPKIIYKIILLAVVAIIISYSFFSPLTYYQPLTTEQFKQRVWFDFWKLKPVE